jgi:transposase
MFSYFSPDSRVPEGHPLRQIKQHADTVLASMNPEFDQVYAEIGRPSIPPERLLKASLLIALYSVRSDRLFCEMLDYNILFRWFLGMSLEQPGLDQSNFSRLRERLVGQDTARMFFDAVVGQARKAGLLSDEHFSVDGTLIEAWASQKSFKPKDGPPSAGGDTDGMVDLRGQRRTNDTHSSITDEDAKQARKGKGKEAKLSFYGGHALMENRNDLCVDLKVTPATETEAAKEMLARQRRKRVRPSSVGGDKGYHTKDFIAHLRSKKVAPHIAQIQGRRTPGLDSRTTRHASYVVSQRKRKRIEETFGWMKAYGGLGRTLVRGLARVQMHAYLVGAAYTTCRASADCPLAQGRAVRRAEKWGSCITKAAKAQQTRTARRSRDHAIEFNETKRRHFCRFCIMLLDKNAPAALGDGGARARSLQRLAEPRRHASAVDPQERATCVRGAGSLSSRRALPS